MFGGLKRTTSGFAIAAAAGLMLGGSLYATPAAADGYAGGGGKLGGDCCADLEERVAELEATTVRKGNKKVSVTLSGWVVKQLFIWDDGDETNVYVGDKFRTLSTHFKLTGTATISPGWTAGYALHIETPSSGSGLEATQFQDNGLGFNPFILHSNMFLKSEKYGTLTWGLQSQASDNLALLPDLSGTIIQSNAVQFEGTSMFLRTGGDGDNGLSGLQWGSFLLCRSSGLAIGTDCNGLPLNAVRYDTPTFGGFSFSASWGEDDFWDVALRYANTLGNFKVSAAVGYNEVTDERYVAGAGGGVGGQTEGEFFQAGASVLHVPTGLFVYGLYSNDDNDGNFIPGVGLNAGFNGENLPEMKTFFIKAGIKRTFTSYGATTFWGEYGEVEDGFGPGIGCASFINPVTGNFAANGSITGACAPLGGGVFGGAVGVDESEVTRYGVGVSQEIDAAAMQLYAQWQHLELDADFTNLVTGNRVGFSADDLEMFMVGGVIFF